MDIRDFEVGPVLWSEDLQFPFCNFCRRGQKCNCPAKDQEECDFCSDGCQCGHAEAIKYGYLDCNCECSCEDEDEDDPDFEECNVCEAGGCNCGADNYPQECECECECKHKCICGCKCKRLVIDHKSFNRWVEETCYICRPECFDEKYLRFEGIPKEIDIVEDARCVSSTGPYSFEIRTLPVVIEKKIPIPTMQEMFGMPSFLTSGKRKYQIQNHTSYIKIYQDNMQGYIRFDGPIHLAGLYRYPEYGNDPPTTWMSLTPMEVFTQKSGVDLAYGHVLIGGLGLGWMTQRVLQKEEVSSVTQVEIDSDILQFFGEPLINNYGSRLNLVNTDFWEYVGSLDIMQFDTILIDIWPKYKNAKRDRNFLELRKLHPNVWGWGYKANKK